MKSLYVIGSLRNQAVTDFANELQKQGYEAFADWVSPGPEADDYFKEYTKARGLTYKQALKTYAAKHIFEFDLFHLNRCDAAVMLMPAGKSAAMELGYIRGQNKPGFIVYESEPDDRYDIMFQFATEIFFSRQEFFDYLKEKK